MLFSTQKWKTSKRNVRGITSERGRPNVNPESTAFTVSVAPRRGAPMINTKIIRPINW